MASGEPRTGVNLNQGAERQRSDRFTVLPIDSESKRPSGGTANASAMDDGCQMVDRDSVPEESTVLVTLRDGDGEEQEALLVDLDDVVACWRNYCQHYTHIKLDKGAGAELREGELVCTNHGAYFDSATGRCTFGPCEGAYLTEVDVAVAEGSVYLVDDEYEFVRVGGIEADDPDLASESNYKF